MEMDVREVGRRVKAMEGVGTRGRRQLRVVLTRFLETRQSFGLGSVERRK